MLVAPPSHLRAKDYPSDSKFMLAYQETAKDAAYNVTSPFVQEAVSYTHLTLPTIYPV